MASKAQRGGAGVIRGWCPTVHEPMPTGDGLLARVKPPGNRLTAAGARLVAAGAAAYGNGAIELTGRGNLQLRGVAPDGAGPFAASVVAAGLAMADPAAERRRNVLVSPLAGDDPGVAADALRWALALERMLADSAELAALPAKFCWAVDGGGALPLAVAADVLVRMHPHPPPCGPRHPGESRDPGARSTNGSVALDLGFRRDDGSSGSCEIVVAGVACGTCSVADLLPALHRLAREAGRNRVRAPALPPPVQPVGFHPYPGMDHGAFGIGLPFGATNAPTLAGLAAIAERFADSMLRLSPWRAVLLGSVRADAAGRLAAEAAALGLIVDRDDPRLRAYACVGAPGCARATVPARTDAARLAAAGFEGTLHVSGCAKGCAHPGTATTTLIGEAGSYRTVRAA